MSDIIKHGGLTSERLELLTRTIAKGASPDELALFAAVCDRTGLDPFARQIYLVPRWDSKLRAEVRQTQVSIDGARLVAQRSGEYAGQTPVVWCGKDGAWREVWLADEPPAAARVGAYRRGFAEPVYATALWREYCPTDRDGNPTVMWRRMPALMLAKCAEALALRKAFPAELSGLYTAEEMAQADSAVPEAAPRAVPAAALPPATPAERKADLDTLLSPTPASAAPAASAAVAAPEPGSVEIEEMWIPPTCQIATIPNKAGRRVWRIDCPGAERPLAVTDADLAAKVEANIAFGHSTLVSVEIVKGKLIARTIIAEGKA